jgi:iron(III) transport system substrate-binding protein
MLVLSGMGEAFAQPKTVAEIALYQGPDRQQILIEGAKKEGQVLWYNANVWLAKAAQEFEKKYPFIKVAIWRSDPTTQVKRVMEEYASGRYLVDVIESLDTGLRFIYREGIYQEHYSPELAYYPDQLKKKGKNGVFYAPIRENYLGMAFNTKLIPPADAPKVYNDLLDPRWKGRMSLGADNAGHWWVGHVLDSTGLGREFLEKMARQDVKTLPMAAAAIADLIVSGEVPLCPAIFNSTVVVAKQRGAPIEWRPLEPVMANLGCAGITTKAPHPHAAMLLIGYLQSKEGQEFLMKGGLSSPREDIGSLTQKFKKTYLGNNYTDEQYERKYNEWEKLMTRLFVKKM